MARAPSRGRLLGAADAPRDGERTLPLAELRSARIVQILSGRLEAPGEYLQDEDEWVVLLAGAARMLVGGERLALEPGDWLLLPAGVAHTVLETEPGTSWLAVHG